MECKCDYTEENGDRLESLETEVSDGAIYTQTRSTETLKRKLMNHCRVTLFKTEMNINDQPPKKDFSMFLPILFCIGAH